MDMSELRANVMRSLGKAFLTKPPFWGVMSGNANPKNSPKFVPWSKLFIVWASSFYWQSLRWQKSKCCRRSPEKTMANVSWNLDIYSALKGSFSLTENHTSIMKSNQNDPPPKKLQNKMPIFLPHPFLQSTLLSSHPWWPSSRVWPPAQQPPCRPWGRSRPQWWYTAWKQPEVVMKRHLIGKGMGMAKTTLGLQMQRLYRYFLKWKLEWKLELEGHLKMTIHIHEYERMWMTAMDNTVEGMTSRSMGTETSSREKNMFQVVFISSSQQNSSKNSYYSISN